MTTQTIPEYLVEERQKTADTQLRTAKEAARIEPLQHGHHRKTKQPKPESVPLVKAADKMKKRGKTTLVARKKARVAGKKPTKTRKRV
jgi:hypothetical protein